VTVIAEDAERQRVRAILTGLIGFEILKHAALLSVGLAQPWGDSGPYWQFAQDAASGDLWLLASQQAFRTPGYPWFLAVIIRACGPYALLAAVLLQHGLVLLTSWMTATLAKRVTGSKRMALLAWGLCAISTARPLYANWLLTETLATALLTATMLSLVRGLDEPKPWRLIVAGLWLGMGVLVRPSLLAAAPALVLGGWFLGRDRRQRCLFAFVGPVVMGLCVLPWCGRNAQQFDRFAMTVFTGRELWTAHFSPWPGGELDIPVDGAGDELRTRIGDAAIDWRHNWSVAGALRHSGLDDAETDALMERVAWQAIRAAPGQAIYRTIARCATFWYVKDWEIDLIHDVPSRGRLDFDPEQRRWMRSPLQGTVVTALRYTPERWFPAMWLWSAATGFGVMWLVTRQDRCRVGILLAAVLVTTTVLTAALEVPLYRYRCVLEPLMIVATVSGVWAVSRVRWEALTHGHRTGQPG
jgi:hypothetical protein